MKSLPCWVLAAIALSGCAEIAQLRAGARTCGDACRNVLSRLLRRRQRPVL